MTKRRTQVAAEPETPEVSEETLYRFLIAPDYRFNVAQIAGMAFSKAVPVEVNASFWGLPELLASEVLVQNA